MDKAKGSMGFGLEMKESEIKKIDVLRKAAELFKEWIIANRGSVDE